MKWFQSKLCFCKVYLIYLLKNIIIEYAFERKYFSLSNRSESSLYTCWKRSNLITTDQSYISLYKIAASCVNPKGFSISFMSQLCG